MALSNQGKSFLAVFSQPKKDRRLNQMLSQLDALATDWEANHSVILGLTP